MTEIKKKIKQKYEDVYKRQALRQNQFDHMKLEGDLHRLHWENV